MFLDIAFENYKAFDKGHLNIRPITFLVGANSVGKSSLMQIFLLMHQTRLAQRNYKSALKLNGGYVSSGESLNLFRKKDKTLNPSFSIEFENGNLSKTLHNLRSKYIGQLIQYGIFLEKGANDKKNNEFSRFIYKVFDLPNTFDLGHLLFLDYNYDKISQVILNEIIDRIVQLKKLKKVPDGLSKDYYYYRVNNFEPTLFEAIGEKKESYIQIFIFLFQLSKLLKSDIYKVTWKLKLVNELLAIEEIFISQDNKAVLSILFNTNLSGITTFTLKTSLADFTSFNESNYKNLNPNFQNNRTIFEVALDESSSKNSSTQKSITITDKVIKEVVSTIIEQAAHRFDQQKINYVSPLRAHPKRYYLLDKARYSSFMDTLDGDAIAETLRERTLVRRQVNDWLKKFNLKIDVDQLKDIIHRLIVNQNSLKLDITDVGFGISQVLPVIIQGFLSEVDSLTLIEQPEIHLHPTMQADLADLFIDIVFPNGKEKPIKSLLIETHSEYLLKRIRRRIAEGVLDAKDVGIYLINPQSDSNGAEITELMIQDKGAFDWPKDFYSGELLDDNLVFLRNQF